VEHIPTQGGVVIVSNHISLFDTLVIPYVLLAAQGLHIIRSPAKEELFRNLLLRCLLTSWGAFPVHRSKGDLRAMRQMCTYMYTEQMMLFPEGTRSMDGRLQAGKRMVGKLIYATRPVVIPTAIVGTNGLVPAGSRFPRLRIPVLVRYGRPLDLERYYALPDTKATAEAIIQEIMGAIAVLLYNAHSLS
jgi:1-acyl-sn-glycerol-3-phosphate acyltransferase